MNVLGITAEGDSGAALVQDGRILAAVNEERLCRMKMVIGFPRAAIGEVLDLAEIQRPQIDAVLVASRKDLFAPTLEPFEGWFQHQPRGWGGWLKTCGASQFSRYRSKFPWLESAYYAALTPSFAYRRRAIRRLLRNELGFRCPIEFVDHHFAHVTSAYFTSGFDDALVLSVDGGGDGKSALAYAVRAGRFEFLGDVSAYNSLGNYYAYVTHLCGFKAMKHEGKITGLAAHGEPRYVDLLDEMICGHDGTFINRAGVTNRAAIAEIERRLPRDWTREDLSASVQIHCENVTRSFVQYWARQTGLRDAALAGGVFANVRVNQEVLALPEIDRVFIHPHMGDGGLSAGAALAPCVPGVLPSTMSYCRTPLADVYFGRSLTAAAIEQALCQHGLAPETLRDSLEEDVAELLVQGFVVARADGRMEYGPRALGNRSILYHPTDRGVNDWLNDNLRRTEFMPFAPAVLYEFREQCFHDLAGGEHAAEFMTITFNCTPWMREAMPGVVHIDGTARPQLVRRDRNPSFYAIIEAFYRRTGLPAIINTSFNMHEEPIVGSADDCVRAFLQAKLDYLAIGPYLVKHPAGVCHPLSAAVPSPASQPNEVR